MNVTASILTDLTALSKDEIINLYEDLATLYKSLKTQLENNQQSLYKKKLELETALNGQLYLNNELESISDVHLHKIDEIKLKHRKVIDDLKIENNSLKQTNTSFENEIDELNTRINELTIQLHQNIPKDVSINVQNKSIDYLENMTKVENENKELIGIAENYRLQLVNALTRITECEKTIEDLNEKCYCLKENFQSKKEELMEKNQIIETLQEKMILLTDELASLKINSNAESQRGNSLFAEVDDQRQKMKQQLLDQHKLFLQMKNDYKKSQHEIRQLKREQSEMQNEFQICANTFTLADRSYKYELNKEIGELLDEIKKLEKKLKLSESRLIQTCQERNLTWVDSMLACCKNETNDLKEQLSSCRIQKASTESRLLEIQQELAKWRFEALKSRCIIINRETILEENNIPFDKQPIIDKQMKTIDQNKEKPDIRIKSQNNLLVQNSQKDNSLEYKKNIVKDNMTIEPLKTTVFKHNNKCIDIKPLKDQITPIADDNTLATKMEELVAEEVDCLKSSITSTKDSSVKMLTQYRKIEVEPKDKVIMQRFADTTLKYHSILKELNDENIQPKQNKNCVNLSSKLKNLDSIDIPNIQATTPISESSNNITSTSNSSSSTTFGNINNCIPKTFAKNIFIKSKQPK